MNSIIDNQLDHARPKPIILTKEQRLACRARKWLLQSLKNGRIDRYKVWKDWLKEHGY